VILAVDSGTTTTRVWVLGDDGVRAGQTERGGARDIARSKGPPQLIERIRRLADRALVAAGADWEAIDALVGFGMITSEFGLEELPHLATPVGPRDLAAAIEQRSYPDQLPAPVFLVPGVRIGDGELLATDIMRGEETEVVGLLALRELEPPLLYVSTGSHSKFVGVDHAGRIVWSLTTLSGELLWALHRETILTEVLDPVLEEVDLDAVEHGALAAASAGLSRALFLPRLLNRVHGADRATCTGFVVGALARSDLLAVRAALSRREAPCRVAIGGGGAFARAYRHLMPREPWCQDVRVFDQPLGAVGARALYQARGESLPATSGRRTDA
jgi:2-dehydro-3-deoxygalactonokinase